MNSSLSHTLLPIARQIHVSTSRILNQDGRSWELYSGKGTFRKDTRNEHWSVNLGGQAIEATLNKPLIMKQSKYSRAVRTSFSGLQVRSFAFLLCRNRRKRFSSTRIYYALWFSHSPTPGTHSPAPSAPVG